MNDVGLEELRKNMFKPNGGFEPTAFRLPRVEVRTDPPRTETIRRTGHEEETERYAPSRQLASTHGRARGEH